MSSIGRELRMVVILAATLVLSLSPAFAVESTGARGSGRKDRVWSRAR